MKHLREIVTQSMPRVSRFWDDRKQFDHVPKERAARKKPTSIKKSEKKAKKKVKTQHIVGDWYEGVMGDVVSNAKRSIGHSLPNPIRGAVTAIAATGTAMRHDNEGNAKGADRMRDLRKKALSGRKIPKFGDS